MTDFRMSENRTGFFDLACEPTSATSSTPPPPPPATAAHRLPRLQHMFQLGEDDSSSHDEEEGTTTTGEDTPKIKIGRQQSSDCADTHIPKHKINKVQFPIDMEQKFYIQDPNTPNEESGNEPTTPPPPEPTQKEKILHYLHVKFPSRIVRRVLKCTIAYFLTTLFSLIHPLSQSLGPAPFLVTTGMLFSHPGRSMGAQFDATVTGCLGIVCAVLYAFAGMASSVAYNVDNPATYLLDPAGRAINAMFLFAGVFAAQMLRQVYPKFHFFSLQFMIIQIFSMTRAIDYTTMPYDVPLNYGIPLLIGHGISLVINLFCWPETAVDGLGRALKETITSSRDMLHMITKQFFLDPQSEPVPEKVIDEASAQMRKGMTKVKTAYREAKYEMSYSYIHPQQLGQIRKSLDRLTKHLSILGGCLKTERELFESAIEALQAEMQDLDSENEDSDHHHHHPHSQQQHHNKRHSHGYHSDSEDGHPIRPNYSEEDLNLLRTALRATNEFMNGNGKYASSRQQSANPSPRNSRPPSRVNSRPGSVHNSDEEDFTDHNQKSVSSLKSFLNLPKLSIPKPKPPKKTKKQTEYHHRHLLMTYLESLRDPLMELSLDCSSALECVCDSIATELDMDDDESSKKTWKSFLRNIFKRGQDKSVDKEQDENKKAAERHKGSDKCNCSQNVRLAVIEFDKAERERMHKLYELNKSRMNGNALDLGMRQELFLVFFFIFTMREVANELQDMSLHMDELRLYSRKASFKGRKRKSLYMPVFSQKMWQKWARNSNHQSVQDKGGYSFRTLTNYIPKDEAKKTEAQDEYQLTKIQTNGSLMRTKSRRESSAALSKTLSRSSDEKSPTPLRNRKKALPFSNKKQRTSLDDTNNSSDSTPHDVRIQVPPPPLPSARDDNLEYATTAAPIDESKKEKAPFFLRIRYAIWFRLQFLTKYEFKFALKMAVAVSVLCVPAFIPSSTEWYYGVRGQWAALTVIAIMNPTSGGTLEASFWRIVGTLVGAFTGWAALEAGGGSPYLLATFAVLLALPAFYIHLGSAYNKVGIVCLITYMVVALSRYAYPPPETIAETVWKRTVTLIIGIFVALLLNSLVWPFVARHMVRKSIAGCMGQLEDYYTYIMGTFLYHDPRVLPSDAEISRGEKMESKIQSAIEACSVLLELTDHEPRFRGPFPKLFYKEMIVSMRNILDDMLSMRVALLKMPVVVKQSICQNTYHVDRRDMIASMLLTFHTLASSLRSKTPLPVYMPSARAARSKLMNHRRADTKNSNWIKFRNLTWFSMSHASQEVIDELEYLTNLIRYIVGESEYADRAKRIDNFVSYPSLASEFEQEEDCH